MTWLWLLAAVPAITAARSHSHKCLRITIQNIFPTHQPPMSSNLSTDARIKDVSLYLLPVETRVPLKFGSETLTTVTCARAKVTLVRVSRS